MSERRSGNDPREWVRRANGNLIRARKDIRLTGIFLEDLCFDAQQAAEKAIKAVPIHRGVQFPYVHDLTALMALIEDRGEFIPEAVKQAGRLTRFAVTSRYPSFGEPVSLEEYEQAVEIAQAVVQWAEEKIQEVN